MIKSKPNKANPGGRPLSYDPTLVREIIAAGLTAGFPAAELDAAFVKEKLCSEHGVKGSIRQEALESLVDAAHAEIVEAENVSLLRELPDGIASAVEHAVAAAGKELLLAVARQHAASQSLADGTCEELRADKRNANHRIAELEGELAAEKEAHLTLKCERDAIAEQLGEAKNNLGMAQAEVARLSFETRSLDRLFAELRNLVNHDDIRATLTEIIAPRGKTE